MNKELTVGIFGGTFDPIHNGHIKLALTAYRELCLDKVIIIPAYIPPHKTDKKISAEIHRVNMTKLAVKEYPFFEVSTLEIDRKGKSYTADTLTTLKEQYERLVFILGADSYMALDSWYHPEIIFDKAEIACAYRDGIDRKVLEEKADEYRAKYNGISHILGMPDTDISSSEIRAMLLENKDVKGLVPDIVIKYIKDNKLYEKI
jgi:nicotinate-nucleotide adenylyltransferase